MHERLAERSHLAPTALLVAGLLGLGSLIPVLRDALVAARLGATDDSDAYFLSTYIILMVVTVLIAESTVPATVVTLSTPEEEEPAGGPVVRALLLAGGALTGVAILVAILAVPFVLIFAPGFNSATVETAAKATAVVAPAILFIGLARLIGAYLNAAGYFLLPAMLTPVIALGAIVPLLAGTTSPVVAAAGWTLGSAIGLVLLLAWATFVYRTGRARHPVAMHLDRERLGRLLRLAAPLVLLVAVRQGPEIVDRVISSGLSSGSLTNVVLAKKTMVLPSTILIAAVGAVVLPFLTRQEHRPTRSDAFAHSINLALFFLLPVSLLLVVTRTDLVTLLYGRGEFTPEDVATTASLLGIYALALVPLTLGIVLQNSFAALDESKTPILPYTISLGGMVILAWGATRSFGVTGLPTAFLVAEAGYTVALLIMLHRRVSFKSASLGWPAAIATLGTALSGIALLPLSFIDAGSPLVRLIVAFAIVGTVYIISVLWFRHPAAEDILQQFRGSPAADDQSARLRIAIETTYAHNQTGTGRYISSLIDHLQARDDLQLFPYRAPRIENLPRVIRLPVNGVLHAIWTQIVFPVAAWKNQIDVIHTTMIAPIIAPCPVVVTVHDGLDFQPKWRPSAAWSAYVRTVGVRAARRATAIITGSQAAADEIEQTFHIPASRLRVIWHGTELTNLDPRQPAQAGDVGQPFLLMVGSASQRKNFETALAAVDRVRESYPVEFIVVGEIPPAAIAERKWLHSLSRIDDRELAWLYAHASCVIVPSRHEGFGYPVLEALTFDTPVVASDIPALREVGGNATRFAPPEDARAFALQVLQILKAPEQERVRIARAGEEARSFTPAWMTRQTYDVYVAVSDVDDRRAAWSSATAS